MRAEAFPGFTFLYHVPIDAIPADRILVLDGYTFDTDELRDYAEHNILMFFTNPYLKEGNREFSAEAKNVLREHPVLGVYARQLELALVQQFCEMNSAVFDGLIKMLMRINDEGDLCAHEAAGQFWELVSAELSNSEQNRLRNYIILMLIKRGGVYGMRFFEVFQVGCTHTLQAFLWQFILDINPQMFSRIPSRVHALDTFRYYSFRTTPFNPNDDMRIVAPHLRETRINANHFHAILELAAGHPMRFLPRDFEFAPPIRMPLRREINWDQIFRNPRHTIQDTNWSSVLQILGLGISPFVPMGGVGGALVDGLVNAPIVIEAGNSLLRRTNAGSILANSLMEGRTWLAQGRVNARFMADIGARVGEFFRTEPPPFTPRVAAFNIITWLLFIGSLQADFDARGGFLVMGGRALSNFIISSLLARITVDGSISAYAVSRDLISRSITGAQELIQHLSTINVRENFHLNRFTLFTENNRPLNVFSGSSWKSLGIMLIAIITGVELLDGNYGSLSRALSSQDFSIGTFAFFFLTIPVLLGLFRDNPDQENEEPEVHHANSNLG